MFTRTLPVLAAVLALFLSLTASAQQKIAVVDLEKLIRLHPNTAEDKKQLEATLKDYNKQKEQLQSVAAATRKAFEAAVREATNPALSEAAKQKAEAAALEKRQAALEADRNAAEEIRKLQRDLNAQELKMLKRTSDEIERAVAAYAKGNGIDLVLQLPSKLSPGAGVVYSKPEMDITAAIMELMGIPEEENLTFHNACHDAYYTALIFQALEHPDEVMEFRETARPLAPVQAHVTRGDLFESVASALQSEQARMPRCAVCARPCTPDGSYVMVAADRYQSLARCSRHGQMLVTLSLQLTGDMCSMKVRADRATRANIAYVHTKRLQEEARRREGRMPDAELLLRRHSDSTREVLVP